MTLRRKLIAVGVVVAICLAVVVTRAVLEGRAALSAGDRAHAAGDQHEAITQWRRAARWYVPGAPHVGRAYDRLVSRYNPNGQVRWVRVTATSPTGVEGVVTVQIN